jgi:cyclic pyranopterin phosphate synthase
MNELTHITDSGAAQMVDIAHKNITTRTACVSGNITMKPETLDKIKRNDFKKGDVLSVARIAGIMAAKQTSSLIPMCHQLNLSKVSVDFNFTQTGVEITTLAKTTGQTGVEMEALVACSTALLTIYDMCKAVDRFMRIHDIQLLEKTGGKSGDWTLKDA